MDKFKKKLRGITRIIFGRTAIVIFSMLMQLAIFYTSVKLVTDYSTYIYWFFYLLGAVVLIHILNEEINSSFKMAWMVPVLLIPVFGTLIYVFINNQPATRKMKKRLIDADQRLRPFLPQHEEIMEHLEQESVGEAGIARYLYHVANYPVYTDNAVEFFPLGEDKFEEMIKQLKSAKKFIFLEYFIVADGYMWSTILTILKEKVKEGVEVRFMYDGMNSLANLPYGYYKDIRKFGIKCCAFNQIKPVLSTCQNNRDHRKILVIDGVTAFTGGVNLADEYINKYERFGHWKDTAIMVKGRAVDSFTLLFLEMWSVAAAEDKKNPIIEDASEYILQCEADQYLNEVDQDNDLLCKGGYVIPYGDGPFDGETIGKQVYIDILNRAKKYVHIMTPYLILDDEMKSALTYCAKRGVETVIIMPHIPDKLYAYLLARTYYKELIDNGVKIYEYTPGFVHAKIFVSDDLRTSVGTINLDFRSLYLHFECSTYVYKNDVIHMIEDDFQKTLLQCEEITPQVYHRFSKLKTLIGKVLRLFAPLM